MNLHSPPGASHMISDEHAVVGWSTIISLRSHFLARVHILHSWSLILFRIVMRSYLLKDIFFTFQVPPNRKAILEVRPVINGCIYENQVVHQVTCGDVTSLTNHIELL